ncbi:hypothetical protein K438DRAFT_99507 [Mycena galopus ATCC 62051]|nr:hypothetical protein K438DRAFT_99507 [Mycena galopus ATCC 62051]
MVHELIPIPAPLTEQVLQSSQCLSASKIANATEFISQMWTPMGPPSCINYDYSTRPLFRSRGTERIHTSFGLLRSLRLHRLLLHRCTSLILPNPFSTALAPYRTPQQRSSLHTQPSSSPAAGPGGHPSSHPDDVFRREDGNPPSLLAVVLMRGAVLPQHIQSAGPVDARQHDRKCLAFAMGDITALWLPGVTFWGVVYLVSLLLCARSISRRPHSVLCLSIFRRGFKICSTS